MDEKALKLTIKGRVQGVNYRRETQKKAKELHLTGYAQNNRDGTVTVYAQGDPEALEKLIQWCGRGPEEAQVQEVVLEYEETISQPFADFKIY